MTTSENLVTQKEISTMDYSMDALPCLNFELIEDLSTTTFIFRNFVLENQSSTSLRFFTPRNFLLMQFCIQGECIYTSNHGKKVNFKNSEYNILYIPKGYFSLDTTHKNLNVLNIYIEEEFFFKHIPKNHFVFKSKDTAVFTSVLPKNLYINPKLKNILNEINTCEFDGHLKMLYLKAKLIELLTLQLAQVEEKKSVMLKIDEIEKMMKVKELIENNIVESYSLAHLAKVAGTNEQYLKKHFKLLHGHTVFGYILLCKMQKAKEMLLTGKYRITEIAEVVGYRHATHFTSAFKKFFGYLPKVLKTKILIGGYFSLNMELEILELLVAI